MRIVFVETNRLTNEIIRAVAGAAPNCVGYPDGVPETWRDVAPVKQGGDLMPDLPMKHFTDETEGGAGGGAAFPDHELDPAALLGPVAEPVDWPEWKRDALRKILAEDDYPLGGIPADDDDMDWPDERGDDEC